MQQTLSESLQRTVAPQRDFAQGKTAYLLDRPWPEFSDYLTKRCDGRGVAILPLNAAQHGKAKQTWPVHLFDEIKQAHGVAALRASALHILYSREPDRQRACLEFDAMLAEQYAELLTPEIETLVIQQNLLPHLWRLGALSRRRYEVLMTRLPLAVLHARLDEAARDHPESPTLTNFRADPELVRAETLALSYAERVVTPHAEIAALHGEQAVALAWSVPSEPLSDPAGVLNIVFPMPTLGRAGAYELRAAARRLCVPITLTAPVREGNGFWNGVSVQSMKESVALESASCVVLPAYVEHEPRLLLSCLARGIPVIASNACGIAPSRGVRIVPYGDADALTDALCDHLASVDARLIPKLAS